MPPKVLVTGAGGFIGGHLVTYLKQQGYWVRGVDIKHYEYHPTDADEFEILDTSTWLSAGQCRWGNCQKPPVAWTKHTPWPPIFGTIVDRNFLHT